MYEVCRRVSPLVIQHGLCFRAGTPPSIPLPLPNLAAGGAEQVSCHGAADSRSPSSLESQSREIQGEPRLPHLFQARTSLCEATAPPSRVKRNVGRQPGKLPPEHVLPMFLSWSLYALAALSVALLVGLIHCLASPLRRVPGPTSSRVTSLLLRWRELRARRTAYIHQLHQRYGPVVRIAPNEVSFTSWPALKEIYCSGGSGYDKSRFYDLFRVYGRR